MLPPLKVGLHILAFLAQLMTGQEIVWLRLCMGVCIRVNHKDIKDTHPSGIPETDDTSSVRV